MWGKLLGGFAGFAMGGPIGALFGAAAGHAYDKMQGGEGSIPGWDPAAATALPSGGGLGDTARQMALSVGVVVLGAKVAKVDGVVNRKEIDAFKQVFRIPAHEQKNVGKIFDQAKQRAEGFEPYAKQIGLLFRREPKLLEEVLASLFFIAQADGTIRPSELTFLRRTCDLFGLDQAAFQRVHAMFGHTEALDPYGVLGVGSRASDEEVKRAYRRLIREHHPDTLMAKGSSKASVEEANQKMAAINAAYDQVGRERGLK